MRKLGKRNYSLISSGVKMLGTFDPNEIFTFFEEELLISQIDEIYSFLKWCHQNKETFGSGNYEEVFTKFKKSKKI